jgi:hypothetical protein
MADVELISDEDARWPNVKFDTNVDSDGKPWPCGLWQTLRFGALVFAGAFAIILLALWVFAR